MWVLGGYPGPKYINCECFGPSASAIYDHKLHKNVQLGGCFAGGPGGIVEQPGCVLSAKILFQTNKRGHLDPKTHPWARELLLKN